MKKNKKERRAFQVKKDYNKILRKNKKKLEKRLERKQYEDQKEPMFKGGNIHYEMAEKTKGINCGGIGAIHTFVKGIRLDKAIDKEMELLKRYLPYHESDHVLNLCYNILSNGKCIEDLEILRNNEVYMDAIGAERIPDPTTEGDFLRRFEEGDILKLQESINGVRLKMWRRKNEEVGRIGIIDVDGSMVETEGECKGGIGISYEGEWGYQPLIISLANTEEAIYIVNRSGNRPSHDGAAVWIDRAISLCEEKFEKICLRGDTDFSLTWKFDEWTERGIEFCFGIDARENLVEIAEGIERWRVLKRENKCGGESRKKPENIKEQIIKEKGYKNLRLQGEDVAEFRYCPTKCSREYRVVALKKNITVEKGERALFEDIRYFFYITNREDLTAEEVVFFNNDRCNQENLIEQLKNGVRALRAPAGDLNSNWAYMVIASLAWSIKAWYALLVKCSSRREVVLRMEFRQFLNNFILLPVQILKTGRKIVYRLINWNKWTETFFEIFAIIRQLRFG